MLGRIFSAGWGQLVAGLLSFLSLRLFSELLGPQDFGVAMLAMGAVSLLDGITSMAFAQVLVLVLKDCSERRSQLGLAFGLARYFVRWLGGLSLLGIILGWWWFGGQEALWLAIVLVLFVATEGLRIIGQTVAMLERRYLLLSSWNALDGLASLLAALVLIRLTGANPVAVPMGLMLGRSIAACLLIAPAIGKPSSWTADRQFASFELPRAVQFGTSLAIMAPLGWLGLFADRYIINATTGIVAAGVIAALAGAVTRPYAIVSAALTNVYRPDLLDKVAGRETGQGHPLRDWLIASLAIGLAGVIGFAVVGGIFSDFIIKFPTPGVDRRLIMILLAVSQVFVLLTHAVDNQLLAKGWGKSLLASQIAMLLIGLPIIVVGARLAGAEGAAIGRIVNEVLKLLAAAAILMLRRDGASPIQTRPGT